MAEIDDFLAGLEGPEKRALGRIRDIAMEIAPEATQATSYGMPALKIAGKPLLGFTANKAHLSLHPFSSAVVSEVADVLAEFSLSKGTIRFRADSPLPDPVVERVVRLRLAEITGS